MKISTKPQTTTVTIDQGKVLARVEEIQKDLSGVMKRVGDEPMKLEDDEDYRVACELLLDAVVKRKWIDEQKDLFMEDVRRLIARVEGWFSAPSEAVDRAESYFRAAVGEYALLLDDKAAALREAAAKLPKRDGDKASEMFERANTLTPPRVAGISITTKPDVEILDESKIPEEYFKRVPDLAKLKAAAGEGEKIPGVKFKIAKTVRVTPKNAGKVLE